MHEILEHLQSGARVLDLGSGSGSFRFPHLSAVRVDLEEMAPDGELRVRADAARLPFLDTSFQAVISNHSLEHVERLDQALQEIGRVLSPEGALYVAVPDTSSWSDRLYRWLASGGGHINAFQDAEEVARRIGFETGLELKGMRPLHASLSFLNRENPANHPPRKARWIGLSSEPVLRWISLGSRLLDRRLGTRTNLYGWAFYFGRLTVPIDERPWKNVCVRCGSGFSEEWLRRNARMERGWILERYTCPACRAENFLF